MYINVSEEEEAAFIARMASSVVGGGGGGSGGGSNVEDQLVALLDKLESLRQDTNRASVVPSRPPMIAEVRTLELWRAVIAECLATVFFVFLVCGSYSPWTGKMLTQEGQLTISLVAGLAMAVLIHSFGQVSLWFSSSVAYNVKVHFSL